MSPAKDEIECSLIAQPDVAAGIINAVYADGVELVRPEDLQDAPLRSPYESTSGRLRGMTRDVAKFCVRNEFCECMFAFEIQSAVDPNMPARVLAYNGVAYRDQIANKTLSV